MRRDVLGGVGSILLGLGIAAYAFGGFQTLLIAAVAGMAIVMAVRADPSSDVGLLSVAVTSTLALAAVYGLLLPRAAGRPAT
jgi:uncharacterized membrane protein YjjP (DUF1212 family)